MGKLTPGGGLRLVALVGNPPLAPAALNLLSQVAREVLDSRIPASYR